MPIDYTKKPTESAFDYNARIASARGDAPQNTANMQAITSATLSPTPTLNPVVPNNPVVPVVPPETDPNAITPTPQESVAQAENERLRALVTSSLGESALKAEKEVAEGVPAIQATERDLTTQLNALTQEAKAIPLGLTTRHAKETGISTEGIGTLQRDQLRETAIKSLTVSSLLEATRGNLASAQDRVERAVAARFDPIYEEIAAARANLQLIKDSPAYSVQDRERARQQDEKQIERQRKAKELEKEQSEIWELALLAAKNGADALTLQKIQNSKNKEDGLRIATPYLVKKEPSVPTDVPPPLAQEVSAEGRNRQTITSVLRGSKVTAGTKTKVSDALNVINAVEDFSKFRQTEGFKGISPLNTLLDIKIPFTDTGLVPFRESLRSNRGRENSGYIDAINLKVQQWASGAALTTKQTEQVGRFTPTTSDTDEAVRTKLNNLENFMLTQVQGNLQSEGITFSPERTNLFELYELVKQASPEQLKQLKEAGLIK